MGVVGWVWLWPYHFKGACCRQNGKVNHCRQRRSRRQHQRRRSTTCHPTVQEFARPSNQTIPCHMPIRPPNQGSYPPHPREVPPHKTWRDNISQRETALRHRHSLAQDRWSEHTKALTPLKIGDRVRIQNQTGNYPNKWNCTCSVVEVKQYHQYEMRVDGSGRLTLRNRRYLRKFTPATALTTHQSILEDIATATASLNREPSPRKSRSR